jgi:mRNA interferase MazF
MGAFAAGPVVVLPFPFSDLTRNKLRPALLLADAGRGNWIACQFADRVSAA